MSVNLDVYVVAGVFCGGGEEGGEDGKRNSYVHATGYLAWSAIPFIQLITLANEKRFVFFLVFFSNDFGTIMEIINIIFK